MPARLRFLSCLVSEVTRRVVTPATVAELREVIADAAGSGEKLELRGGGSKAGIGAPERDATIVSLGRFSGIVDYDPAELVLDVLAGTKLAEVEALVAAQEQMLAFEPFDHGPILGAPAGAATIGGVVAAAVAGSARLTAGSARDHFLGFEAVSGRGTVFVGGAKVVKNVTGYDLPKLFAGSWGRLGAMTRVTLKVLPRPRTRVTLALSGLTPERAQGVMALAMRSQAEVAAAAYLPAEIADGTSITALRIQGFGPSVAARAEMLKALLGEAGVLDQMSGGQADAFWQSVRDAAPLDDKKPLWRLNVPPSGACAAIARLEPHGASWFFDWAAGLIWASFAGDPAILRAAALAAGGHATLVRAPDWLRATIPVFQPESGPVAALSQRVRRAFDPAGVFETDRFLDHAN